MFIAERIRLHKAISTSLHASRKLKQTSHASVQESFRQLRSLQRDLRSFNQKHPLFCRLVWLIDHLFAFHPLKREMARLKRLSVTVHHAFPMHVQPLPRSSQPPYLELMELLHTLLYKQRGSLQDQISIDLLHFIMQSTQALHQISAAFQRAEALRIMPDSPATHNSYDALIQVSTALSPLIQALNQLERGQSALIDAEVIKQIALKKWNALKLPLFALKILLDNQPLENPFDGILKVMIAVDNSLDGKVIEARRFLERRIFELCTNYKREKIHLKIQFPCYPELVQHVVRAQLRSYKKLIRLHVNAHIALNYSPLIADLAICQTNPDDRLKEKEYQEFIRRSAENNHVSANLFLPYASETLQRIRAHSRVSVRCRKEVHEALMHAGVQAYLRLHTPLT